MAYPLLVRVGNHPGASFRLKAKEPLIVTHRVTKTKKRLVEGQLDVWERCAVAYSGGGENTYLVIVPAEDYNAIEYEGFYVRGYFHLTHRLVEPREASEAFRKFQPL